MAPREDELEAATGCLDDSPRVEAAEAAAAAEPPAADLPPPPADLSPPPRAPPPPIHTSGGSLPSPRPSYGTPPEEDGWTASGPFRAAPLTHVLHAASTPPSGTPQASPRHSGPEPDLEAPLLGGGGARQRAAKQAFGLAGGDGSGGAALAIKACVFGLINTAAGIVSGLLPRPGSPAASAGHPSSPPRPPAARALPCRSPRSSPFAPWCSRTRCTAPSSTRCARQAKGGGEWLAGGLDAGRVAGGQRRLERKARARPRPAGRALRRAAVLCDRPPRPPRGTRAPAQFFYLSSAVHQAVVSARSAVPHAVGQVQVRWWGRVGAGRALHYSEPHAAAAAAVCSAGCAMWCTPHHHPL